jgi:hypothetical protein
MATTQTLKAFDEHTGGRGADDGKPHEPSGPETSAKCLSSEHLISLALQAPKPQMF